MHHLNYEYVDPGSGYQEGRRILDSTQAHAQVFLPLLELLESMPDLFCIVYYDESTPHLHQFRPKVWTKLKEKSTPAERKVKTRKPGKGPSIRVSGAVGVRFGGFVRDAEGFLIGSFKEKQQAKNAGEPVLENSNSYIRTLLAIVQRIKDLFPQCIPVICGGLPCNASKK